MRGGQSWGPEITREDECPAALLAPAGPRVRRLMASKVLRLAQCRPARRAHHAPARGARAPARPWAERRSGARAERRTGREKSKRRRDHRGARERPCSTAAARTTHGDARAPRASRTRRPRRRWARPLVPVRARWARRRERSRLRTDELRTVVISVDPPCINHHGSRAQLRGDALSRSRNPERADSQISNLLEGRVALRRTTMADIAARAGCSLRTLYDLAPSRDELVLTVIDRNLRHIGRAAVDAMAPDMAPLEAIRAYLRAANLAVASTTPAFARDQAATPSTQMGIVFVFVLIISSLRAFRRAII